MDCHMGGGCHGPYQGRHYAALRILLGVYHPSRNVRECSMQGNPDAAYVADWTRRGAGQLVHAGTHCGVNGSTVLNHVARTAARDSSFRARKGAAMLRDAAELWGNRFLQDPVV